MKLSEVRPFIARLLYDTLGRTQCVADANDAEVINQALAEAFMAGVRSQGLRYQKDSALWAACGCEPTGHALDKEDK